MAKRYHESRKEAIKRSAMIHEDHNAPSLLPQHVIESYWPVEHKFQMHRINGDLFDGVQKQLREDYADLGREMKPKKY